MYKNLMLGVFVLFASLLLLTGASAITLSGIPDVSFDEDGSNSSIDLDDYVSNVNGNVTFTYSGNTHVHISIDANHVVTFTADANWNGQETITFNATDASGSDTDDIKVTVNPVNDAPVLNIPSTLKARAEQAYSYQVNASDVDGDALTYSYTTDWQTFSMSSAGLISFTPTELDIGSHSVTISVSDGTENVSKTINFQVTESCDDGSLVIDDVEIDDVTGDDDQLEPGDYLEIDLKVRNKLTTLVIEDVEVKAWIEDSGGDRITEKVEADKFDVDEKDYESTSLKLRVEPDTDEGTYTLVIEAKGEDEDGTTRCNRYTKDIEVEKDSHKLLLDNLVIIPSTPSCGGTIELSIHVFNIGKKDESNIRLKAKITDLGIEEYSDFFDLDEGKDVTKTMTIGIPDTASGEYWLELSASYNDGKDTVTYDMIALSVSCGETAAETESATDIVNLPDTTANVEIGETAKFTMTITNTGNSEVTYTVTLDGASGWADADIEPSVFTLKPGASMPVYIYITPKSASTHTVTVSVYGDGQLITTRNIVINVEGEEAEIEMTEWGHRVSTSQMKGLIQDYVGTVGLIILVALLVVLAALLYVLHNRKKPEVTYIVSKRKRRK